LSRNTDLGFSTRAIHMGYDPMDGEGALTPPVHLTSTYVFDNVEHGAEVFAGIRDGHIYGRTRNPTQTILEERLANLEGAKAALAVGSGMGAISALLWTLLATGGHVVIDQVLYGNTAPFTKGLTRFGVNVAVADFTRPETVADAICKDTQLLFFETPANPNLQVIDIAAIGRTVDVLTVVDRPDLARVAGPRGIVGSHVALPVEDGAGLCGAIGHRVGAACHQTFLIPFETAVDRHLGDQARPVVGEFRQGPGAQGGPCDLVDIQIGRRRVAEFLQEAAAIVRARHPRLPSALP